MNPLLDSQAEKKYDAMIAELDNAGYVWNGSLAMSPEGYKFHGLINLPFYMQVYRVWDYYQYKLRLERRAYQ